MKIKVTAVECVALEASIETEDILQRLELLLSRQPTNAAPWTSLIYMEHHNSKQWDTDEIQSFGNCTVKCP